MKLFLILYSHLFIQLLRFAFYHRDFFIRFVTMGSKNRNEKLNFVEQCSLKNKLVIALF